MVIKSKKCRAEDGILEFTGGRVEIYSTPFDVDPAKKYNFSAEIRTKPGAVAGICYLGNWSITAGGKRMQPEYVTAVDKSDTEMLEDAAVGSLRVVIAKPACWEPAGFNRNWHLAFETNPDLSDLPNLSVIGIASAEVDGDRVILTLKNKLRKAYVAGTKVRFHRATSGMYGGLSNKPSPEEWTTITWTVSGRTLINAVAYKKWWHGAEKGAIRIIANYNKAQGAVLQVRNVTMDVVE